MDLLGNYSSDEDKDKSDEEELESPKKLSTTRKSDTDKDRSDDDDEELEPPKQLPTTRKDVTKETKKMKQSSIFAHDKFKVIQYQKKRIGKSSFFTKGHGFIRKEEGPMAGHNAFSFVCEGCNNSYYK